MDKFLHQCSYLNPPRERDTFDEEEQSQMSPLQLQYYMTDEDIDASRLYDDENAYVKEAMMHHSLTSLNHGSNYVHVPSLPPKPVKNSLQQVSCKGNDRLEATSRNMELKPDPRLANIVVKKRQSSSHIKMLEATKLQGKEILENMRKLHVVEDQKVVAASAIIEKQLTYFKL
jgi:hypothetical protein